jgi:prepilin-type N-terminal cleavage/methylation domain-containing protein
MKNKAFTLIELLVVISIMGLLTTMGIAGYSRFNNQQIVRRAAEEMKIAIRQAAARAKNNEKDCAICDGADNTCATSDDLTLTAWHVNLSTSPPTLYGECGAQSFPIPHTQIETFGVSISPTTNDIEFYPPGAATITNLGTTPLTIIFSKTGANNETILVNPSGNVE